MNDKSYKMQRLLTSADDLDAITENGIYWYYTESLPANVPFKNSAIVEVFEDKTDNTKKFSVASVQHVCINILLSNGKTNIKQF